MRKKPKGFEPVDRSAGEDLFFNIFLAIEFVRFQKLALLQVVVNVSLAIKFVVDS